MDRLPREITAIILRYTVFSIIDRGRCIIVCRLWHNIITQQSHDLGDVRARRLLFLQLVRRLIASVPAITNVHTARVHSVEVVIDCGSCIQVVSFDTHTDIDYSYRRNMQAVITKYEIPPAVYQFRNEVRASFGTRVMSPFTYVRGGITTWRHQHELLDSILGTGASGRGHDA